MRAWLADTHTEQASFALGVPKHLLHSAILQRVDVLAGEFVPIGGMQWAAALGLQQHVREQEEHLGLCLCTFRRNHIQPALADVPPPCERREEQTKALSVIVVRSSVRVRVMEKLMVFPVCIARQQK